MKQAGPETFLDALPPQDRQIAEALRDLIRTILPDAEESLLWGSLSFHLPAVGGRVKGAVCLITVKAGQIRLEFIHGVRLSDPAGLLQGNRVSKRFLLISSVAEAGRPEVAALIREAAALLERGGWTGLSPDAAEIRRRLRPGHAPAFPYLPSTSLQSRAASG